MFYDNFIRACQIKKQKPNPVAMKCGGTKSSATSWKNGASPNSDIVAKIAEYLEVSTDFLLLGKATVDSLSSIEQELINSFRKLSPNEQQRIIGRCEEIASSKSTEDNAEPEIIEIAARSKKGNAPKISTEKY